MQKEKVNGSSTTVTTEQLITLIVDKARSILDELLILSKSLLGVPMPLPKTLISSSVERTTKMAKSCLLLIKVIKSYLPSLGREAKLLEDSVIPLVRLVKGLADTAGSDEKTNKSFGSNFHTLQTSIINAIRALLAGAEAWKNANRVRTVRTSTSTSLPQPIIRGGSGIQGFNPHSNSNQSNSNPSSSLSPQNLPEFTRNLTKQISELCLVANSGATSQAAESALYNASRNALRSINELVIYAQDHNLTTEESDLREASYVLFSTAKNRLTRGESSQKLDQATKQIVDAIRNFLTAVNSQNSSSTSNSVYVSGAPTSGGGSMIGGMSSTAASMLSPRNSSASSGVGNQTVTPKTIGSLASSLTIQASGQRNSSASPASGGSSTWVAPDAKKNRKQSPTLSLHSPSLSSSGSYPSPSSSNSNSSTSSSSNTPSNSGSNSEGYEERMRAASVKEFKESETKYYTQLKQLVMYFIEPIKKEKSESFTSFCKEPSISVILSTTITISSLTKQIISDISKADTEIGTIFKSISPVFKMYQDYINFYERAIATITELREKDSKIDHFIKKFCLEVSTQDISFFLILPVQRLPRYEMLISNVAKFTPANHPDYNNLNDALIAVRDINQVINLRAAEDKNRQKIMDISQIVSVVPPYEIDVLFSKKRLYLREGMLVSSIKEGGKEGGGKEGEGGGGKSEMGYWYMFSDVLLKCRVLGKKEAKKGGKKYELVGVIEYSNVRLEGGGAGGGGSSFVLVEEKEGRRTEVGCLMEEEMKEWVQDLTDAISVNKLKKQTEQFG
eukprot:TRINITY_DN5344_c0_g1_i4.p1 TRINITY_DN5344_c0_g1~~TRINITY_DN5344_c0_g1_i4.p1  ORF type:complete len:790 (-),score=269.81 TRINITY_DN5344_c0_g1_i4:88-2457(-)